MKPTLDWQIASVKDVKPETDKVKSFTLTLPSWMQHRAGQHYDLRLTAEDGYQTQRSYSIASEPEREGEVDITVERINDGEVSTYLHDVLIRGDQIEVRGPIGGYFVWEAGLLPAPLLLIAGGSGVVALMSLLRHRATTGDNNAESLLYGSRNFEDIIYFNELEKLHKA